MNSAMKVLLPLSWPYAAVMVLRNRMFDWNILKSESVGVPVISVGNLSVGGTGKTPLVEYITGYLLASGRRPAVVSRGYRRSSRGVVVVADGKTLLVDAAEGGDEPVQIAAKFPGAIVVVGEKKVAAAKKAVQLGADVIVVDDGFQHRYLRRNLDIVVVDATGNIRQDAVLPAGRLREPLQGIRRAHLVAFSKTDQTVLSPSELDGMLAGVFNGPRIRYRYLVREVRRAHDDGLASLDVVRRMRLLAFSGIGMHEAFSAQLVRSGFGEVTSMRFSDHHPFSEGDIRTLTSFATAMGMDACITTEKDVVRLRAHPDRERELFDQIPVFYLKIETEILGGQETLHELIENCLRGE